MVLLERAAREQALHGLHCFYGLLAPLEKKHSETIDKHTTLNENHLSGLTIELSKVAASRAFTISFTISRNAMLTLSLQLVPHAL